MPSKCRSTSVRSIVVAMSLALVGAACSSGGTSSNGATGSTAVAETALAPDQTLRINTFFQPPNFDPGQSPGPFGPNALIRQYTEPLLRLRPDGKDVVPAAVERFDVSSDGLTYTFHLRRDGRYNDGQPVKAQDFVFGWRRLVDPRLAAPLGSTLFAPFIKGGADASALDAKKDADKIDPALDELGLRAPEDNTFVVTLAAPAPEFKYVATIPAGAPVRKDVVDRYGSETWGTKTDTLVTNGPFRVSEAAPGQSVTLVPNGNYRTNPTIQKIVAVQLSGQNVGTAWTKYLNNELDISNGPPEASYAAALKDPNLSKEVISYPEPSISFLEFNTTKPPFDNVKVRQAFSQALDREAFAKLGGTVSSKPLASLIPEGVPGYRADAPSPQKFDASKAKATLDSSGVNKDLLSGLHLLIPPYYSQSAQFVQDQFQRNLGVNLVIDSVQDNKNLVQQGKYDIYLGGYYQASYPDPRPFYDLFLKDNPGNDPKWTNGEYERLVRQADSTSDIDKRLATYQQAEQILLQDAPVVPYSQTIRYFWIKPWVKGVKSSPYDDASFPGALDIMSIRIAKH